MRTGLDAAICGLEQAMETFTEPSDGVSGIARPFIPWIGSKEKLIPYIWQVFPSNPKLYLEPFGGGGALLLGIQPKVSRMDIYNDFNCDLVNLFLCARECTVQLVQELKFLRSIREPSLIS